MFLERKMKYVGEKVERGGREETEAEGGTKEGREEDMQGEDGRKERKEELCCDTVRAQA